MPVTVENTTPWNTEELTSFLTPLCKGTTITEIEVNLLRASPGVKRKDQSLYEIDGLNLYNFKTSGSLPNKCTVKILSPKRAAARTDLLDRMAQVGGDLEPHEINLPEKITNGLSHAFTKLATISGPHGLSMMGNQWDFNRHFFGGQRACDCRKPSENYKAIRGNTKTRTAPPVDIDRLKRRGRWALEAAESHRVKMEANLAKAQKIGARIMKLEAKASDDASVGARH